MGGRVTFRFNSLHDLGEWTITCEAFCVNPEPYGLCCYDSPSEPCGWDCLIDCTVGWADPIIYHITVYNRSPTATITYSPTPAWNQTLTFDARADDPDDGSLVYRWSVDQRPDTSTTTLLDVETEHPRLPLSSDDDIGEWRIQLDLDDNEGERRTFYSDEFTVPNLSVDITIGDGSEMIEIYIGDLIALEVTPSEDPDGGDLEITWELLDRPDTSSHMPGVIHTGTGAAGAVLPPIDTTSGDMGPWRFMATARDNELIDRGMGEPVSAEVTVEVLNRPPEVDISGEELITIGIGETIQVDAVGSDPDGGLLHFRWDIVQAPQSADIFVEEGYFEQSDTETSHLEIPTVFSDCYEETPVHCSAGTWIVRVVVTDDEGDPNEDEVTQTIVVDAPPEARIDGPEPAVIGMLSLPLELDGSDSLDPDSRCGPPDYCHETLPNEDGSRRPVAGISTGIEPPVGGYAWSLVDLSFELWGDYPLGRVDEVFDVPAHLSTLTLGFGDLEQGDWTFQLDVIDGEGNEDTAAFTVSVVDENGAPVAVLSPPMRYTTSAEGDLSEAITLDGSLSFDLYNILVGEEPRFGISSYTWSVLEKPPDCVPPDLPFDPTVSVFDLYDMGARVPPDCQGFWRIGLTVMDDDDPQMMGSGATTVIIGNCPEPLCIDHPTAEVPQKVEFVEGTDVTIEYHLKSSLYATDPEFFAHGCFTQLEIFHESDMDTPVYTDIEPNPLASDLGGLLEFHWNGYGEASGSPRPRPGLYSIKIWLVDYALIRGTYDFEPDAIELALAEPLILASSDRYVDHGALEFGRDRVSIDYEIVGSTATDELRMQVLQPSGGEDEEVVIYQESRSPEFPGNIQWNGRICESTDDEDECTTIGLGYYTIRLETYRLGARIAASDPHPLHILNMDLDVDADRDGALKTTDDDDGDEESWAHGAGHKGAIVLANSDDDDNNHLPDNWVGGDFDYSAGDEAADTVVNGGHDDQDLAPLVVRKSGLSSFPSGFRAVLRVQRPSGEAAYFSSTDAHERIRIFWPTNSVGDDLVIQTGDRAIIGPAAGEHLEFVASPASGQKNISLLHGNGNIRLGLEGILYGSPVDIILEFWEAATKVYEDRVRVRVAPFILNSHLKLVSRMPATDKTVFVAHKDASNEELRESLRHEYTDDHLDEPATIDTWHQDGYEIGYSKAPYGAMPVILGLPRGASLSDELNTYVRQHLLQSGVGLIHDFQNIGATNQDAGGNLETIPGSPQEFIYGEGMKAEITDFLQAQDVQTARPVDVSFLSLGHVDEVASYCPDGTHMLVADPEIAWALLSIARATDATAVMLEGMEPFASGHTTVEDVASGTCCGFDPSTFNLIDMMDPMALPALRSDLGIGSPTSVPAGIADDLILTKAGGLIGFFPNDNVRTFRLTFVNDHEFNAEYQEEGAPGWTPAGTGDISGTFVTDDYTAFVLYDWWDGIPAAGDVFTFTVDPTVPWLEVPVLFKKVRDKGLAFTTNFVNSLVDGNTIFAPLSHGPRVDLGTGAGIEDIFEVYVEGLFERAGYTDVIFVDDRAAYHNLSGSIHCGTNVRRNTPAWNWWE